MPLNPPGISRAPLRRQQRPRALGPPDVYPQDPNQKEDELNAVHVKQGFTQSHASLVTEEYGSLVSKTDLSTPITPKVLADLKAIQVRKEELNTLQDTGKRRQSLNTKDNFWLVMGRSKPGLENWFRDLTNTQKPFSQLIKKVPIFNKKEEMLSILCEYKVPSARAVWYIKMSAAYASNMSETNKTKKRSAPDVSIEWTQTLIKFLKEQLQEYISLSLSSQSSSAVLPGMHLEETKPEQSIAFRQWTYCLELCDFMYYQGLLDRQEFLTWLLEQVEKSKYPDEPTMRIMMPVILQYGQEFTQNELLSRKLAYNCAKKITYLVNDTEAISQSQQTNGHGDQSRSQSPLMGAFHELLSDPYTRGILEGLSSIVQTISLECPTALVFHYFGENKTPSSLLGSPLDYLPNCTPSGLPLSQGKNEAERRNKILKAEKFILERSQAVEAKWLGDRSGLYSKTGNLINTILSVLEDLDSYVFEKMDSSSNWLDSLYNRLFDPIPSGSQHDTAELASNDEAIIHTLCEWAVTSMRSGDHRAFVVAKLLERRQSDIGGESDAFEDKEDETVVSSGPLVFQDQLIQYLDTDSPTMSQRVEFGHLILLFYQLICHDVFSHDGYICRLISRGDLVMGPISEKGKGPSHDSDHDKDDSFEESKIDGDLTKIVNQIKEVNQLEGPFSPPAASQDRSHKDSQDISKWSRHWQYLYHLPLPQDETSVHDANQRNVLLYGVGKGKEELTKTIKKLAKEVVKLFGKKLSIDVTEGGKVKKTSKSDSIFEAVSQKFQNLSYFDQHYLSHLCGQAVLDMLSAFTNCNANYLPVPEYVSFLFDLSGQALNIQAILDWSMQILKELPNVDAQLCERSSSLSRVYSTSLALYVVGVLRRYQTILFLNPNDVIYVFDQLSKIAYRPLGTNDGSDRRTMLDCNSAEWCILAYLYELCSNFVFLRSREKYSDLKRLFSNPYESSVSTLTITDARFGLDYIEYPKKKIDPLTIKLLTENPQNQYNLVCNTILKVCECNDTDKLNEIAILCCEFTAQCNSLSAEWLCALTALCNAGGSSAYQDLVDRIPTDDHFIYNRLSIFVSILTARHIFPLQSFFINVAIPPLLKAWEDMKEGQSTREVETCARLSCHLILKLFKSVETFQPMFYTVGSPSSMPRPSAHTSGIKYSCDRHLLASAQWNTTVGAIIAVLKAILVLGDADKSSHGKSSSNHHDDDDFKWGGASRMENASLSEFAKHTLAQICLQDWVHERCLQIPDDLLKKGTLLDHMLTAKQAQKLLRLVCIKSANLREVDMLGENLTHKRATAKILDNLDEWNLRISAVELKLMYHQMNSVSSLEVGNWLESVAGAIVDIFQLVEKDDDRDDGPSERKRQRLQPTLPIPSAPSVGNVTLGPGSNRRKKYSSVWIIPYLVKHLKFLQSRVLKVSGQILEKGNWSRGSRTRPLETTKMSLGHQPFLRLVLTCLKELDGDTKDKKETIKPDREEQKENLLQSLHTQLSLFMCFNKDEKLYNYEDPTARKAMQDALQLRFSLVGGLFETICRNTASIADWCTLLIQIIARGVVDLTNNADLFTHVLDMLTILIHSTLINDKEAGQSERSEETRRHSNYQTLVKKLKKEITDKNSHSIGFLRQLLPFPKEYREVIATEPFGTVADAKGNKSNGLHSDKKQGLQVGDKIKVNPWDLVEGHKNPTPLSWSWFGAVRCERKAAKYEEIFHELKYADFSHFEKPSSYYLEPPPLPQEDLEPPPKDVKDEDKLSMFSNQSNDANLIMMLGNRGGMQTGQEQNMPMANRDHQMPPKYQPRMVGPSNIIGGGQIMQPNNQGQGQQMMFPNPNNIMMQTQQQQQQHPQQVHHQQQQPNWNSFNAGGMNPQLQQQQQTQQQPMGYQVPPYGSQQNVISQVGGSIPGAVGPRYPVPGGAQAGNSMASGAPNQNSKQALHALLRMRGGPNQYVNQTSNPNTGNPAMQNMGPSPFALPRQQNFIRQPIRPNTYPGNQMATASSGGMNDGMSSGGQFTSMGGNSAPQQQFGTSYANQQMGGSNAYMMRAQHQGGYNQQSMINRHPQPNIQSQMMANQSGGYNMAMNRMAGTNTGNTAYMQSTPNVNMNYMQQQTRPIMSMQQQQQQQQQQQMMRMQTPQLMAQLQRGPQNMGQQQLNYQQQNRF